MILAAEVRDPKRFGKVTIWLKPFIATILLSLLQNEMEKVRLQFRRIRQDTARLHSNVREEIPLIERNMEDIPLSPDLQKLRQELSQAHHDNMVCLFADIHFLLICLDKMEKLFKMLRKELHNEPELAVVFSQYSKALKEYSDFRNYLEHVDREVVEKRTTDLGNLGGDKFTFNERTFDIGHAREREVEELFKDILEACGAISERQDRQSPSVSPGPSLSR